MRFLTIFASVTQLGAALASQAPLIRNGIKAKGKSSTRAVGASAQGKRQATQSCSGAISPKVIIVSMFSSEAEVWYTGSFPSVLANNVSIPGLSPLDPYVHCTSDGQVCQLTTGEGEINAASSITALWTSSCFDLTQTYFMVAGIAGINPHVATTGSVTFAKYAVQFDLQYEFAQSQVPSNDSSGYFPQGANYPDSDEPIDYPTELYGTEVFELNDNLKKRAVYLANLATLNDNAAAQAYRDTYGYAPANQPPTVVECETGTSNVYWSGSVLGDAFSAYTRLLTNNSGTYCATQQEDNAHLESLLRGALAGKVDFSRIIVMRTASDFDRAPPDESEVYHLLYAAQEGFGPSIENIYLAGVEIVSDVLMYWNEMYASGIKPGNYIGDVFDSLGSSIAPDIGTPAMYIM